ncbi:MAG: NAD-dependent epimerase/dehydratase family protein [Bacteroidales bacterium]|nr:NAD-dependent epimerase/dehydratase family protein [Bacteroidales bacterium]
MDILVTGSSGYIGSNFINIFKNKYNFFKFSLQENDIDTLNLKNIDTILHCAALVHQKIEYDYKTYYAINVQYPIILAKKAKENGVKQFIFISTIAVYGEEKEEINKKTACTPITPYGKSKLEAEKQLKELCDENFIVSIIRTPMVYGKDAPGNIKSLINLVKKIPVLPFSGITNKRSFIYIGNLIYLIDKIIEKKIDGVFLASDDTSISTTYLIEQIAKELDNKIYLVKIPFFESLLKSLKPSLHKRLYENFEVDNTSSKKILNMENTYSVEQGIHFMIHGENK